MRPLLAFAALAAAALPASAAPITITAGPAPVAGLVVSVPAPDGPAAGANAVKIGDDVIPAQLAGPGLNDGGDGAKRLTFVVPKLAAGQTVTANPISVKYVKAPDAFSFQENPNVGTDLLFGDRRVVRYRNVRRDGTSESRHMLTFKPFHQLWDPATGSLMLSSDAYLATDKTVQFPHHRGLFYGWMKINYGAKATADIWHGKNNVFSEQETVLLREVGEVLGRERDQIGWHGGDGERFAEEKREVTAYRLPGGTLLDWQSELTTQKPKVVLDGDPQHSGFHFRASQEVFQQTKAQTVYVRPDGKGKPGETRNWDAKKKDPQTVNLPWNAMSFVVGGKRHTIVRVPHPSNPGETRGSERDYGRFGDYFEYTLTPDQPLKVRYRLWLQEGEMSPEECAAYAAAFRGGAKVE